MSERKIVQARSAFATTVAGHTVMVSAGDVYYSDDPLVKGREGLFGELEVKSSRPAPSTATASETTSAAPGSRRSLSRPPEKPAAKSAAKSEEGKSDA